MISYKKKIILNLNKQEHPYFLVTPSIIPFLTSISALFFVTEIVNYFYFWSKPFILILSFLTLTFILFEWFYNVAIESDYHTKAVQYNNKVAFMLFILTEIMFFFSLFWAFFHGSLSPSIVFDNTWPPKGIDSINAFGPPIWGTWVLWLSSIYALYIKEMILTNFFKNSFKILRGFVALIVLAILFTICQLCEFYLATFSFREGFYGAIFYLLTGFHGIHVIIGTIFLLICGLRCFIRFKLYSKFNNFQSSFFSEKLFLVYSYFFKLDYTKYLAQTQLKVYKNFNSIYYPLGLKVEVTNLFKNWKPGHFSGLESSVWYWQFVDIVWIFVWIIIYIWGNNSYPFNLQVEFSSF